jgi:hypothetical protein
MKHELSLSRHWAWYWLAIIVVVLFQSQGGAVQAVGNSLPAMAMAPQALPSPEPGVALGWLAYHVDAQQTFSNMSQHSLRLSSGYPQIAFGGDHLYYAYEDAGGWHTQTADSAWGVGSGAALALDSSGKAHISYYDLPNGDLKYATNKWGAWFSQTVVSGGNVGAYSDIAIDSSGDPAIVYYNSDTSELHYIYFDSGYGDWGPDATVASASDPFHNGWFSFALNTGLIPNKPYVSYYYKTGSNDGYLRYAKYNASNAWINESVDSCSPNPDWECNIGEYNSLALDPTNSNRPVIVYSYLNTYGADLLMYMAHNGSNWVRNDNSPADAGSNISMGIDSTGDAHISYQDSGLKFVKHTHTDTWSDVTALDASTGAGMWSSLALVGVLAKVAHYDTLSNQLKFINHDRTGWLSPETVATQGDNTGMCSSLAFDGLGRAHISYSNGTNNYLKYARYNSDTTWTMNTIDASGNATCFSIIAYAPNTNDPAVGYVVSGNLYYRSMSGVAWGSASLIDSGVSSVGTGYRSFGMALASDGAPHFAYRKGSDLWYRYWTGSGWSTPAKLVTGSVGSYIALALSPSNQPSIAYYRAGVLYHTRNSGGWSTEAIATNGASGSGVGVALAVDQAGQVTAAYLNNSGTDLRVANLLCSPICGWTSGVLVDTDADEYFWLALDRKGKPHLAASGWSLTEGNTLHYITQVGSSWVVQVVDDASPTGWYPSIGLTPDGMPRISYYDLTNKDLKFVFMLNRIYIPIVMK